MRYDEILTDEQEIHIARKEEKSTVPIGIPYPIRRAGRGTKAGPFLHTHALYSPFRIVEYLAVGYPNSVKIMRSFLNIT
jgi:hypothetical protein